MEPAAREVAYVWRMYVCMAVCMYVCMYVWLYVCMYGCTYVCMYVCMHLCMSLVQEAEIVVVESDLTQADSGWGSAPSRPIHHVCMWLQPCQQDYVQYVYVCKYYNLWTLLYLISSPTPKSVCMYGWLGYRGIRCSREGSKTSKKLFITKTGRPCSNLTCTFVHTYIHTYI